MTANEAPVLQEGPRYWELGADLDLVGCQREAPAGWDAATGVPEEVAETVLLLHLAELTGVAMAFLKRGDAIEPAGDVAAVDRLGRLHVFELKKDAFAPRHVDQLEQYLLGEVFRDPEAFREDAVRGGRRQLAPEMLARSLLGARAGRRMANTGAAFIAASLQPAHPLLAALGGTLTKSRYGRMSPAEQLGLLHAACVAASDERSLPSLEAVLTAARRHGNRLLADLDATQPRLRLDRPLVLWVAGARIGSQVRERLRRWRRAGLDARPLEVEVRHHHATLLARVVGERAPARQDLERQLLAYVGEQPDNTRPPAQLDLYKQARPSDPIGRGGGLLATPTARIDRDATPVVLRGEPRETALPARGS